MLIKNFRYLRIYLPIKIQNMLTKRDVNLEHNFDGKNMRFNNFWSLLFKRRFELDDWFILINDVSIPSTHVGFYLCKKKLIQKYTELLN